MDKETIIEALKCCAYRKCKVCPYYGKGIACKYRLMDDAAKLLEEAAPATNNSQ